MNDIQDRMKARSATALLAKHVPVQLPLWGDDRRAIANELARTSLFHCGDARKARRIYNNETLFVLGEGTITYKGEELRSRDEDFFLTLVQRARELPNNKMVVQISSSDFCKDNDLRQSQTYYKEIFLSIQRMKSGIINVYSRRLAKSIKCQRVIDSGASESELIALYDALEKESDDSGDIAGMMLSLISGEPTFTGAKSIVDGIPQGNLLWELTLDKQMVTLFAKPFLTLMRADVRRKLSAKGRRLYSYFASHREPHPVLCRSLENLLGQSYKEIRTLKKAIKDELEQLEAHGAIESFEFSKSADGTDWKVHVTRCQAVKDSVNASVNSK